MGRDVASRASFTREDRIRYRQKVRRCLDVFALMLDDFKFDADRPTTGLEVELNLVDPYAEPAMRNAEILANLADPTFQTELGQFNLELNARPRLIEADGFADYEADLQASLARAGDRAAKADAAIILIGILPTLTPQHLVLNNISTNGRYRVLNEQIVAARGEDIRLDIRGVERLQTYTDSIAPEAGCTSVQFHLQVSPDNFANYWNASQAIAAVQVALGANAPYFYSKQLWAETRIVLFEQATDTRPDELKAQGVRPRVWFGERWITSVLDLFSENARYFPALMPVTEDTDPLELVQTGKVPDLSELRLHNGTIWRWNRPVYDVAGGEPHVRIENRVLPAGPTPVDMVANGLFFYGLLRTLVEADRPLWSAMSFEAAEENFTTAARRGLGGPLYWPGCGWIPPDELVLQKLLPLAAEGLARWGVTAEVTDRYLPVIERRCTNRRTGASWQLETVAALEDRGADRPAALRDMFARYLEASAANEPVHAWPIPA